MKKDTKFSAGCIVAVVGLMILGLFAGGYLLEYVVETSAAFFGKTADVPMPHVVTIIAGAVLSEVLLPAAVVVWLLSFVLR